MKLEEFIPDIASQHKVLEKSNTILQSTYDGGFSNFAKSSMGGYQRSDSTPLGIEQLYFDWLRTAYAYRRMFIQDLYLLAFDIAELRIPILSLRGEIFRKGLDEWVAAFVLKCKQCGEEYQEKVEKCERCGSKELRKPNKQQIEYFESVRDNCNVFGQSFEEILKVTSDDINIVDDSFIMLQKDYMKMDDQVWTKVSEIRRLHPALVEFDLDKNGLPRNSHFICPFHREEIEIKPDPCPICGYERKAIMYIYNHRGRRVYLFEDEVIHSSKFSPSETYGYSPLLTIMQKVLTISGMDRYLYRYFFERKAPSGLILTYTDDAQSLEVERARVEAKMLEDPTYMPWIAVSQKTGRGRTDFVKLFHTLNEMDYLPVRNEIRDRISAIYGVPQMYMNIMEGVGPMAGQSVSGDTPIWIRKDEKFIDLIPIEALHHNSANQHSQFPKNLEVLSQDGWTKPKNIWRHKCREDHTLAFEFGGGFAETTVDHSLMKDKQEVKASDLKVGDSIDIVSLPTSNEYHSMTEEFAWLLGFYSAEGSILFQEAGLEFANNNDGLLSKCKNILESKYNKEVRIAKYDSGGRCLIYGNSIVEEFKELVYYSYNTVSSLNSKPIREPKLIRKVPTQILNGREHLKQAFLDGYIEGDGSKLSENSFRCVSTSLLLLAGIEYLAKTLGYKANVEFRKSDNDNWNHNWRLSFGKNDRKTDSNVIKRIISLDAPKYVFDIETESHTFVGGIGCLVFHNTQQVKVFSNVIESDQRRYNEKIFPQIMKAFHITDWKLRLKAPEEKIESIILQQAQQKVAIATQMMTLGFTVDLKPGADTIEEIDFLFTGKAQNPMMAAMSGGQGQLPAGGEGSQGGEGAEGGETQEPSAPPQPPAQGVNKSMDGALIKMQHPLTNYGMKKPLKNKAFNRSLPSENELWDADDDIDRIEGEEDDDEI